VNTLVIGGTGKVGRTLVAQLLAQKVDVTVLLHSPERAQMVPAPATAVVADLIGDPEGARAAFQGRDAVFMLNKATLNETAEGLLAVQLAREAGVPRFVYQTVHLLEQLAYLPHVAPKLAIKHAIEKSGMDYTFVAPNHFYQNDEIVRAALLQQGVYLTPLGSVGCWSVDARDIADAAAAVLTSAGHGGNTYNVVGPDRLTGDGAARAWTKALGKEIRYVSGIGKWRDWTRSFMPAWLHYDLSLMYEDFAERGMLGTAADVERLTILLGRPPRGFQDYALECAHEWLA
jgi:uncharacterized protein YbjT (DUF2867 family)